LSFRIGGVCILLEENAFLFHPILPIPEFTPMFGPPSNGSILIDGEERGYTNQFVYEVPAGLRNLTLTKPGYQTKTLFVDLPAGWLKALSTRELNPVE
jgi:hypothetical protein